MKKNNIKKIYINRIRSRGSNMDIFELGKLKIKRIFSISGVKKNITRGYHAHKYDTQIITVPYGKIKFKTYDGKNKKSFIVGSPNIAIIVKPYVWTETTYLKKNTIVTVYSSHSYNEKSYIRSIDEFEKIIRVKSHLKH